MSGQEGLALIDAAVGGARAALDTAVRSVDARVRRRGEVRLQQAEGFQALAKFRLEHLQIASDTDDLSQAERKASKLLAQHAEFVAHEYNALKAMLTEIEVLEKQRAAQAKILDEAIQRQEAEIKIQLKALAKTPAYEALQLALEEASAVTQRATQKLELARTDREEKGKPYEDDPLFAYLWARKFRNVDYKANGLTRMLDGWVGRLCGYDKAHLTYARLTELPERLAEHVTRVTALEAEADAALKAIEAKALRDSGVDAMEAAAEAIRADLRALDVSIEAAEAAHLARSATHTSALQAKTGPAEEARQVLAEALHRMSFPDLRVLVSQTIESEDDEIVDGLVRLRAEEMQLDLEMTDQTTLPQRRSRELEQIEALRNGYKRASYASHSLLIDPSVLEDVLIGLRADDLSLEQALSRVRKTIKRADQGGGGAGPSMRRSGDRSRRYRRDDTAYGFEDIAAQVAIELAKAAIRHGGRSKGFDIDLGGSRRGGGKPKTGSGRSGRGGYKTGGRF